MQATRAELKLKEDERQNEILRYLTNINFLMHFIMFFFHRCGPHIIMKIKKISEYIYKTIWKVFEIWPTFPTVDNNGHSLFFVYHMVLWIQLMNRTKESQSIFFCIFHSNRFSFTIQNIWNNNILNLQYWVRMSNSEWIHFTSSK